MVLIKYLGGRSRYFVDYNRKSYNFIPENNKTLDIQEKEVINYIFSLPNRAEFEVVEKIEPQPIIEEKIKETKPIKKPVKTKKGGK